MNKKRRNEQTELHQFWQEPSCDGDLFPCQVWIWLEKAFSSKSPETEMLTDKQMDGITPILKGT